MTENNELIRLSAAALAQMLAAREVTAVEVTQAYLDRIAAVDGKVHAFLHVNADEALAVAAEVDAIRAAGGAAADELHVLAGVPIAVKDLIVTIGQPTTAGTAPTTPPSSSACAPRRCRSSARRTWTSSRWARPPNTPPTAPRATPGTWTVSRADPAVAPLPPSRPSKPRWPSARTPVAPSASPAPSPAPSASSPPTAVSPATAPSPWPPPWTRSARSPARCWTLVDTPPRT